MVPRPTRDMIGTRITAAISANDIPAAMEFVGGRSAEACFRNPPQNSRSFDQASSNMVGLPVSDAVSERIDD